jgi:pimeloyl-ACP methyl ester carboxylesterase
MLPGDLPYLAVGDGTPLVYLAGWTANHRVPKPGLERRLTLRTVTPLANAGFEVYFTNRRPGMTDPTSWAELAAQHADALATRFGRPVHVIGHSSGGSLLLQILADRPEVVDRAVVACAAYRLGPVAKRSQLLLLEGLERTGRFTGEAMVDLIEGMVRHRWIRVALSPALRLAARAVTVENPTDAIATLRAEDGFDVRDRLDSIPNETLVICGARDHFWTLDMFAETAYRMPRGRLIMYPDSGHGLVTTKQFFTDVIDFLT